jgi:hypothetical protein
VLTFLVLSMISAVAVSAVWLTARFSTHATVGELTGQIDLARADRLFPFVEGTDLDHAWDDDKFWQAIGGPRGLDEMSQAARIFTAISLELGKHQPELKPEANYLRMMARYLHWQIVAAVIEDRRIRSNPQVPRVQARTCARLYCDMASTLDTINQHRGTTIPS